MNTIQPIQALSRIQSLESLHNEGTEESRSGAVVPFQSLFQDAVSNAQQAETNYQGKITDMVTGRSDNLHDIMIASRKAGLSLDLVVELRNKLLDAYKEIMNTSV